MYGFSPDRWREFHWTRQIRFKAYYAVGLAIARGDIPAIDSNTKCVDCNAPATCYEHRNYFYPLTVDPVCKTCDQRRGQGWPPPEGPAIADNGVPFQTGRAWNNLEAGSDKVRVGRKSASLQTRVSEFDDMCIRKLDEISQFMRPDFIDLNPRNYKYSPLARGDLRAEYFKQHDPYYICEDIA